MNTKSYITVCILSFGILMMVLCCGDDNAGDHPFVGTYELIDGYIADGPQDKEWWSTIYEDYSGDLTIDEDGNAVEYFCVKDYGEEMRCYTNYCEINDNILTRNVDGYEADFTMTFEGNTLEYWGFDSGGVTFGYIWERI